MSAASRDQVWRDELVRLGGSIHQDDAPPLSDEEDAVQQAGIDRFLEMLDAFDGVVLDDAQTIEAILWALHPIDDYGVYEAVYGVLSQAEPGAFGTTLARVLPTWLTQHGDHDSIATGSLFVAVREPATEAFMAAAAAWSDAEKQVVRDAVTRWNGEFDGWEPILGSLGMPQAIRDDEPIPVDWPDDWRAAAEAFRESGRVDRAWSDQRDFSSNFPGVLAIMELDHARWREVPDFLNPLFVRRRAEIPAFIAALADLPEERRERILAAVGAARPDTEESLRALLGSR